jgi:hypothetical protein
MKKLILILLVTVLFQVSTISQIIGNLNTTANTNNFCVSALNFSVDAEIGTQLNALINWGDGTSEQLDTTLINAGFQHTLMHTYANNGTFQIATTLTDSLGNLFSDNTATTCGALRIFNAFSFSDSMSCISSVSILPAHTTGSLTLQVSWGDGENSTEIINDVSPITDYSSMYKIYHRYHSAGHFQVIVNAVSNLDPDTVFVDTLFIGTSGGTCGRFSFHVLVDINNDQEGDSPYDDEMPLIVTNYVGASDTVYWKNRHYFTTAVDVYATPYTVNLDQNWLTTMGYSVTNFQPFVIDSFDNIGYITIPGDIVLNTSTDFYSMPKIETYTELNYLSPCFQYVNLYSDYTSGTITGTIDWGDGIIQNIESSGLFNYWEFEMQGITSENHHYEVSGNYTITTQFSNSSMPDSIYSNTLSIYSNGPNCGSIPLIVTQSNDTTANNESISVFVINSIGDTTNFEYIDPNYAESSIANVFGLNVDSIPYTIGVHQSWLTNNGLVLDTMYYQTVTSFTASGVPVEGPLQIIMFCDPFGVAGGDARVEFAIAKALAPTESGTLEMRICTSSCNQANGIIGIMIDHEAMINFSASQDIYPEIVLNPNQTFIPLTNLVGCDVITLPFNLPGNTQAGYPLNFHLNLQTDSLFIDQNMDNNQMDITVIVMNSYDPNNKICTKPFLTELTTEKIGYRINFQNDGNYPALNIVVKDTISENLNLSTIKLIAGSHHVTMSINYETRVVHFIFDNINLPGYDFDPVLCKGHVDFTIDEIDGLEMGTSVFNTAYIYFDFNPAIITNTAEGKNIYKKVVTDLNSSDLNNFTLYPNPSNASFQIVSEGFEEVSILDLAGKTIFISTSPIVKTEELSNGMYHVMVKTKRGIVSKKLIVQH